jgi:hypothetical protein
MQIEKSISRVAVQLLVFGFVMTASNAVFAYGKKGDENHPCKKMKAACESAGFTQGQHKEGKGLWKDCLDKISNGQSVAGVTIDPTVVEACKGRKENKWDAGKEKK